MPLALLRLRQDGIQSKTSFNRDDSRVSTQRNPSTSILLIQLDMIEGAKKTGTDRIELYTEALRINRSG
jgi:hypothetical protein